MKDHGEPDVFTDDTRRELSQQDPTARNYGIAEAMYKASANGDAAGFFAPMSPDVVMREPGFLPYGGTHRGLAALQALTAQVAAFVDLTSMVVDQLTADGDRVLAFCRLRPADGAGEIRLIEVLRFIDGRIVEMDVYYNDTASLPVATP